MEKQRITYLDMAKGVGIILVVMGHSTYTSVDLLKWITSFHMPLFFIVSGMLIYHTQEEKLESKVTIVKKAKSIMLPYLTFSLLYISVNTLYYVYDPITMPLEAVFTIGYKSIIFMGSSVLWFLPTLFFSEIFFVEIRRRSDHNKTLAIVVTIGIIGLLVEKLILSTSSEGQGLALDILTVVCRVAAPVVLLAIGYYIMKFSEGKQLFFKKKQISVKEEQLLFNEKHISGKEIIIAILLLLINIFISRYNGTIDLSFMMFNNYLLFLLGAASGTMAVVLLCKNIKVEKLMKGLAYFGKNSLIIMATHIDFYILLIGIKISQWVHVEILGNPSEIILYLLLAVAILIMEIIIIYVYNRWLPFLLGKEKPKV